MCVCSLHASVLCPMAVGWGYYAPPLILIGGALSNALVWCLTFVAYIGPKSRTERPRKTKIGTEVAHVTCDSDTTFKVKRSRSPGRLLTRQAAAAVGVGTCWPWETADMLHLLGGAKRFGAHREERGVGIPWWPPAHLQLGCYYF